jgi:hypothetical protein
MQNMIGFNNLICQGFARPTLRSTSIGCWQIAAASRFTSGECSVALNINTWQQQQQQQQQQQESWQQALALRRLAATEKQDKMQHHHRDSSALRALGYQTTESHAS